MSLFFTNLVQLPFTGNKIQLPEIYLGCMFLWGGILHHRSLIHGLQNFRKPVYLLFLPACIPGISLVLQPTLQSALESLGAIYLGMVALLLAFWISSPATTTARINSISGIAVILGFIITVVSLLNIKIPISPGTDMTLPKPFPFIGTWPRVTGYSISPNMQASVLLILFSLFIGTRNIASIKLNRIIGTAGAFALLATGSKVLITAMLLTMWVGSRWLSKTIGSSPKRYRIISAVGLVLYMVYLHVPCLPDRPFNNLGEVSYLQGSESFHPFPEWTCRTSTYTLLKEEAIHFFREHPLSGLGSNQFSSALNKRQTEGLYPSSVPAYDPHSTYFGILAENGLTGFCLLIIWIVGIGRIAMNLSTSISHPGLRQAIRFVLLFFLVEGLVMDVLNHRGLWVILGLLFGLTHQKSRFRTK